MVVVAVAVAAEAAEAAGVVVVVVVDLKICLRVAYFLQISNQRFKSGGLEAGKSGSQAPKHQKNPKP